MIGNNGNALAANSKHSAPSAANFNWRGDLIRYGNFLWAGMKVVSTFVLGFGVLLTVLAIVHQTFFLLFGDRVLTYILELSFLILLFNQSFCRKGVAFYFRLWKQKNDNYLIVKLRLTISKLESKLKDKGLGLVEEKVYLEQIEGLKKEMETLNSNVVSLKEKVRGSVDLEVLKMEKQRNMALNLDLKQLKRDLESMLFFKLSEGIEAGLGLHYQGRKKEIPTSSTTSDYFVKDVFLKKIKEQEGCINDRHSYNAAFVSVAVFKELQGFFSWEKAEVILYKFTSEGMKACFILSPNGLEQITEPPPSRFGEESIID